MRSRAVFELADPWVMLLLPLPLVIMRLIKPRPVFERGFPVPDRVAGLLLAASPGANTAKRRLTDHLVLWAIWGLTVFALSGPRELQPASALKVSGRDLAIVLDLSGSMVRDDFYLDGRQITRLEAVTRVGSEFARRRAGDRVALIVFGSEAYFATPFTFDTEAVARRIEEATIGISGRATNISDGLGLALKRLADSQAASRVVILLSDGVNNAGATNPRGVAELAAEMRVRVHTIALGPKDLESAEHGERGVVDAATLRAIADVSGGAAFRVKTTDDLIKVTQALDRLEATDSSGLTAELHRSYWTWPAAMASVLALIAAWRQAG